MPGVESIEDWWGHGEELTLPLSGVARRVFVRSLGAGPTATLLHGFPSSSHDWARIAPALARDYAVLMPDFLGFGASEKPPDHVYSLHEQADLVEALWAHAGVTATRLVGHDYAVSVIQELLARRAEGRLGVEIEDVHLLNGGVYPDLHRAQPTQLALLDPEQGPKLSAMLNESLMTAGLGPTFAPGFDAADDCAAMWTGISRDDGQKISHLLIAYITDRATHAERWVGALESCDVPLAFSWGMLDPVSGAHMAQRIRERLPDAPFQVLEDVCHWPPLEASGRVLAALRGQAGDT
jgi:pimeloyl-ACP methyl ester carboxylesterase